jgi:hypothetical protein
MKRQKIFFTSLFVVIIGLALGLRFYRLGSWISPYWEEVAIGYDAFSILKTGRDHHGNFLPIAAFESFGDWKPSLYFYTVVPFIKLLGLSVTAVRLPSALAGVSIVVGMGILARKFIKLGQDKSNQQTKLSPRVIQLGAMLVTALNPWALHFSRAGWEAHLATALVLWGVIAGFKFLKLKSKQQFLYLFLASLLLVLAAYSYHSARLVAPLLGLGLVLTKITTLKPTSYLKKHYLSLLFIFVFSLALISPLVKTIRDPKLSQRFKETSLFSQISVIKKSNQLKHAADHSFISKLIYHRYVLFTREVVSNIFDHFSLDYLYVSGDGNPRHSVQYFGLFYHFELIFLFMGLYWLIRYFKPEHGYLFFWILIGLIPPSLTKTTPHALRTLLIMPAMLLVHILGLRLLVLLVSRSLSNIKRLVNRNCDLKYLVLSLIGLFYLAEFAWFWNFSQKIYPQKYSQHWQAGYKQLIAKVDQLQAQYPDYRLLISRSEGRPAMYYWFYQQTDPSLVQKLDDEVKQDQSEYLEFEQLEFVRPVKRQPQSIIFFNPENVNPTQQKNCQSINQTWCYQIYD